MKIRRIGIFALLFLLVAALPLGCAKKSSTATPTQQTVTVQRGTLKLDVTASGNLALAQTADLAFDVSGYVYRVAVEAGDPVKKGQVVAEVDPFDWEKQKRSLERAVIQAKISVNNAQISLEKAENPTTTTSTVSGAISAPDPLDIETKRLQLQNAKMSLDDAQKELDRYLLTSAQLVAPFDGFVTAVNVKGGDELFKGKVAVSIADPTKFKSDILVNEMDINRIQIGMPATVQITASPASMFPAKVTGISPTATNSSGVVNYKVEVELLSAEEIRQLRAAQAQAIRSAQSGQAASGQTPSGQTSAGQSSRTTQGQSGQTPSAPSSQATQAQSGQSTTRQATRGTSQSTTSAPLTLEQLRDGLSVTINVTVQEKQNVLIVPNRAITRQGTSTTVQVLKGETPEPRVVKTGISNIQYTEIVEGLNEGEKVVVATTTTTTTTSGTSQTRTQSFGVPGMGMPPR